MCRIGSVLVNGPTCAVEVGFCPFDKNRLLARPCPCPHPLLAGDRSMPRLPRRVPRVGLPLSCLVLAGLCACGTEPGQQPQPEEMVPVLRGAEITPALHHDESAPLRLMPVAPRAAGFIEHEVKRIPRNFNTAKAPDPALQSAAPALLVPTTSTNFDGVGQGFSGPAGTFTVNSAPPDTNGDVGPNHYVQIVNESFAIFNKSGTAIYGPVPTNTLWSSFGGGCQTNDDGDATVVYDRAADRWIFQQFSVSSTPFLDCVAVSTSGDPTGSYARYAFSYSNFPDYPKLGVWPDGYYVTFNMFTSSGTSVHGPEICALDRTSMLAGQPATQQCKTLGTSDGGMLPSDNDGTISPPAGAPNDILEFGTNSLKLYRFHLDWANTSNTTLTGPTTIPVAAFTPACNGGGTCIPQSGTSQQLDSLADRLMYRLEYRNFGDHDALVVNHSIVAGSSVGVRWYELRNVTAGTPTVYHEGTYAPESSYRSVGSDARG